MALRPKHKAHQFGLMHVDKRIRFAHWDDERAAVGDDSPDLWVEFDGCWPRRPYLWADLDS